MEEHFQSHTIPTAFHHHPPSHPLPAPMLDLPAQEGIPMSAGISREADVHWLNVLSQITVEWFDDNTSWQNAGTLAE